MRPFAHLATRLFDVPLLVHPDKAQILGEILAARIAGRTELEAEVAVASLPGAALSEDARKRFGTHVTAEGIAIVPIDGTLVQKSLGMRPSSGMRSYQDIQESVLDVATDPRVRGILLDVESPGGEVNGLPDMGDVMVEAAALKPMWAVANDYAHSAAYWIACCAEQVWVSRTSSVGSVGVIMVHMELSKALADEGRTVKVFRFGEHKAELNRLEPLTAHAIEAAQAEIDRIGEMFVAHVGAQRGMDVDAVRATQAGTYHGPGGVEIGFADRVGTLEDAHAALVQHLNDRGGYRFGLRGRAALHPQPEEADMAPTQKPAGATPEQPAAVEPPPAPAAPADAEGPGAAKATAVLPLDVEQARAAGRLEQAAYEKRVRQVCMLAGKPQLAQAFVDQRVSVESVVEQLVDARAAEGERIEIHGEHEGRTVEKPGAAVDMAAVHADAMARLDKASRRA